MPGGSSGNLCLGDAIGRILDPGQILNSGSASTFTVTLDLTAIPTPTGTAMAQPGESWSFQAWHRDLPAGSSNFTEVTTVTFQ